MWGAGGTGVAAVSLSLSNARDCFLHLPPALASSLRLQQDQAVKTSWDNQTIFLGWTEIRHCHQYGGNIVEINRQLAEKLGIRDGQQIFLEPCSQVLSCQQVEVEPLSADDWEILELHAFSLESHLLDQIRIVFPKAIFPVWVEQHTCIYIQIVTLKPAALYGRLEARTELFIRPKLREYGEGSAMVPSEKNDILQNNVPKTNLDPRGTTKELGAKETNLYMGVQEQKPETKASLSANVLPNIWNLIGSIFSYSSDKRQEPCGTGQLDSVKDSLLNLIHMDSIFRVCHVQPPSIQTALAASIQKYNTVHVFPWHLEFPPLDTNVKISYGRMSKLLSPKQQHQESKQNLLSKKEKQMINAEDQKQSSLSKSQESNEISVVQIVWSGFEDLKSAIMCSNNVEQIHIGRVWVSPVSETCRRSVLSQMWKICSLINIII